MKKLKKKFETLREGPRARRYLVLALIQIVYFALISIPMIWADGKMDDISQIVVLVALFCFSLAHGILCAEITGGIVFGNLMFALLGGIYAAFIGRGVVSMGDWSAVTSYFFCVWYFLRYSACAFFVSLVAKNTKM